MELTQEQIDKYVEQGGTSCPYCGSDQLQYGNEDLEAGAVYQRVSCLRCNRRWTDSYTLTNLIEDED
jgi:transposase-like protein